MPRYAARRTLPAPVEEVWDVLADPARWPEWWPGLGVAQSSVRRALAPGAHWQVEGGGKPSVFRRPQVTGGGLLVLDVVPFERVVFQLTSDRIDVELGLDRAEGDDETVAALVVEAPRFGGIRRTIASDALAGLASLVRKPAGESA